MLKIREAVIVEGKYDKIKLSGIIDALIIETDGFRIFKDKEKVSLLKKLAETTGLLILTDSDSAGFLIRNYLTGIVPSDRVKHAYIRDIEGKEKRKNKPSKEGLLGVEGVDKDELLMCFERAGATPGNGKIIVTKTDFFHDGLTGGSDSKSRRERLCEYLGLPKRLSANQILDVINAAMSREEYENAVRNGK